MLSFVSPQTIFQSDFFVLFPGNNGWELRRLQFSQQCPQTLDFIHSNRCVLTSHCSLGLHLGADKWCWLASHRLGCHRYIFLVWHLLKYCPFKNYVIYTFIVDSWGFFLYLCHFLVSGPPLSMFAPDSLHLHNLSSEQMECSITWPLMSRLRKCVRTMLIRWMHTWLPP